MEDDEGGNICTFSISPAAKPTTIARPFHAMHFKQSIGLMNTPGALAKTSGKRHTSNHTDGIVYHVDAFPSRELHNVLLPIRLRIVDNMVSASVPLCNVQLLL